jgi:hypothetical protein
MVPAAARIRGGQAPFPQGESIRSRRNSAAVVTAIVSAGIWFSCPAAQKIHSPWAVGVAAFLIAYPIYRLACYGSES